MTDAENLLAEEIARYLPHLDMEARVQVQFTSGYRSGIQVEIDDTRVVVPWAEVAQVIAAKIKEW